MYLKIFLFALFAAGILYFIYYRNTQNQYIFPKNLPSAQIGKNSESFVTVIAQNLNTPWAIAFLPDKRMLVTERVGNVRIVDIYGAVSKPIATFQVVNKPDGEGGLLGITLHPQFLKNKFVYLYYTYSNQNKTFNKVVRTRFENNKLRNDETILDKIPASLYHDGGRIKFGPDGYLYVTTGDAQNSSFAQDTASLAGKILRITDNGLPAPGNPFGNEVYSYGHRNPQGIAWDSAGRLWQTEHGRSNPTGYDEINLIKPGKNYGWEVIQGDQKRSGMETPKLNSGATTTWAPSGMAIVGNSIFFAGLKGESLYKATIQDSKIVNLQKYFTGKFGRMRDVVLGPDNMLYVATSNRDGRGNPSGNDDKIIRVEPKKL